MELARGTFLIDCKESAVDKCKIIMDSVKRQYRDNIIAVYQTMPFSHPESINANVSGSTNFIVEARANAEVGLEQLKNEIESQMKPNIDKPITVY